MCGRIIQSSAPLRLTIVAGLDVSDSRMGSIRARYYAAPSRELGAGHSVKTGEPSLYLTMAL
jgi:hypothetical protein